MTAMIKKPEEPTGPLEMPADWRCDLEAPRSRLIADAIALIEREGGPEPSAVKKNLTAYRRIAWESKQAGSGPNLQQQLHRADAKVEALRRECEPCPSCRRGADPTKLKALTDARQERGRIADSLAARHALLDRLMGERVKALAALRESVVRALADLVNGLGIPAMLNRERGLYLSGPEEIRTEIVRRCAIADKAGELARRVDPLAHVGGDQVFAGLDVDLAKALRRRLDMPFAPEVETAVA